MTTSSSSWSSGTRVSTIFMQRTHALGTREREAEQAQQTVGGGGGRIGEPILVVYLTLLGQAAMTDSCSLSEFFSSRSREPKASARQACCSGSPRTRSPRASYRPSGKETPPARKKIMDDPDSLRLPPCRLFPPPGSTLRSKR